MMWILGSMLAFLIVLIIIDFIMYEMADRYEDKHGDL